MIEFTICYRIDDNLETVNYKSDTLTESLNTIRTAFLTGKVTYVLLWGGQYEYR